MIPVQDQSKNILYCRCALFIFTGKMEALSKRKRGFGFASHLDYVIEDHDIWFIDKTN